MHKSLVLALFLGAVKPNQVFEMPLDDSPTDAEAFAIGFNEALEANGLTDLIQKPYAEEGLTFKYAEKLLDFPNDTTELYGDQSCGGGIARWDAAANSKATYDEVRGGGLWTDPLFGADDSSLYWPEQGVSPDYSEALSAVVGWKRPRDIIAGHGKTMYGGTGEPAATGIHQGQVGDCWFLASLAAMAEEPQRITDIIDNPHEYPESGAFRFNFWVKDKWVGINVDDQLPVIQWGDGFHTWATSKSTNGAWWTPLFEKAYAKLDQNYDRIQAGSGFEGLKTLSGMPVQRYQFSKIEQADAWNKFHAYSGRNFPMTTPCCSQENKDGLISGHAYTFLGTVELSNGVKLAQVRNPWGSENYKGPWSDHDSQWNADFLEQAGHSHGNDGSFFMPFDYYMSYFYELNVAYHEPYEQIQRWDYTMAQKMFGFNIENPTSQEFYITVETLSDRNFPRACPFNTFINTYLIKDGQQIGGIGFVGNGLSHNTKGYYGEHSPAGNYDFQIYNWNWDEQKQVVDLTVSVYAKKQALEFSKYA